MKKKEVLHKVIQSLNQIDLAEVPGELLVVPAGKTFVDWHRNSRDKHKHSGDTQTAGSASLLADNVILQSWLSVTNAVSLTPTTLLPLGILVLLYNMYIPKVGGSEELNSTGEQHPLYSLTGGDTDPTALYPFSILLGRDVHSASL